MNKKVLVIDDNPYILEAIELILTTESYDVKTLTKGDTIVKTIDEFQPNLLILDLLLSGENGQDITKELKNIPHTKDIPIIIISAHPRGEKSALSAGADAFIAKPFNIDDLLHTVETFIN